MNAALRASRARLAGACAAAAWALCAQSLLGCSGSHRASAEQEPSGKGAAGTSAGTAAIGAAGGAGGDSGQGAGDSAAPAADAPTDEVAPAQRAEVWKGETQAPYSGTCLRNGGVAGPMTAFGNTVVVVAQYDAADRIVAASVLFSGPAMPAVDAPMDLAFTANCGETPLGDVVYPAVDLLHEGSRVRLGVTPLGVYADWCESQTPVAVEAPGLEGLPEQACRAWDAPDTVGKALCYGGSAGACVCADGSCELSAPVIYLDLERDGDRMLGILERQSDGLQFGAVKVSLRRIE